MSTIAVYGSLNADYIIDVRELPLRGQTIIGGNLRRLSGGKGGNQAHAAALTVGPDIDVRMIGHVGHDEAGEMMRRDLSASGADVSGVLVSDSPSGVALITIASDGSNTIVVSPGANAVWPHPTAGIENVGPGDFVLLQLEIPIDVAEEIAAAARVRGARVVLNAAPADVAALALVPLVDLVIVNEIEAAQLLGIDDPTSESVREACARIRCELVVTRGADGCLVAEASGEVHEIAALNVDAIDSVGAGDAFVGALVAALAQGASLPLAARVGSVAGGLTATVNGPRHPELRQETLLALAGELA